MTGQSPSLNQARIDAEWLSTLLEAAAPDGDAITHHLRDLEITLKALLNEIRGGKPPPDFESG